MLFMQASGTCSPFALRAERRRAAVRTRLTRVLAAGTLLLAPAGPRCAELSGVAPSAGSGTCSEAAMQAEQAWNLPDGLLGAIGRTESGRPDPGTGRLEPSRWAINAGGTGHIFDSAEAAVAYVQDLQAHGIRSIDVGCFQINLLHHPAAFASLGDAFDANANAAVAAQFLSELHQRAGDWELAVARYHSALPERGEPYRMRVLAQWHAGASFTRLRSAASEMRTGGDPVVVMLAHGAAAIPLFTPANSAAPAAPGVPQSGPLPIVFRPSEFVRRQLP